MNPFLSIIIPTFNSEETLKECLDSILKQTFVNWEVWIIDGVSNDKTVEIANYYNDERIKILSEPDKGIYDAMNKGIRISTGKWLYFLGCDDTLYDNVVLQTILGDNDLNYYDIIYGNVYSVYHGGVYNGEWNIDKIGYNICHQSIFYKRNVFKNLGKYNTRYLIAADHDLNIKWFFSNKLKSKFCNIIVANFAGNGISSTNEDYIFNKKFNLLIFNRGQKHLSSIELKEYASRALLDNKHNIILRFYLTSARYVLRLFIYLKKLFYVQR